jgi:hypothetical protein
VDYFRQNFGGRVVLVALVLLATAIAAVVVARRPGSTRRSERVARTSRVCFVGFVAAAIAATTNGLGGGQGFIWGIGDGGLELSDLRRFPNTIQSVLLVGNVAIYIPVGLSAAIGWPLQGGRSLLASVAVPIVVEGLQVVLLQGVGSTDDVILNAIGVLTGRLMGAGVRRVVVPLV